MSVAEIPMSAGSRVVGEYIPDTDATIVTRILDAGGTITGVTSMNALAFSAIGDVSDDGPIFNPRNEDHYAGGSSAGAAAAVADGAVDIAIGGDQGSSVCIPAV